MKPKRVSKLFGAAVAAFAAAAMMAPVVQADTPNPGYSQFAGCPSVHENSEMSSCLRSVVTSGNFKMGNKNVPIEKPIVLSGGVNEFLGNFSYNSKGGMPPVNQKVPGGVVGLTGLTWLLELLGSEALTLYAATELAGKPTCAGLAEITLPIKVHLINGTLGNKCYVGSSSNPITLHMHLTKEPVVTGDEKTGILTATGATYFDNTFSAPGASGCVLTLFGFIPISINGLVNTQSGLPAATGNETTQNITTELVDVLKVYP